MFKPFLRIFLNQFRSSHSFYNEVMDLLSCPRIPNSTWKVISYNPSKKENSKTLILKYQKANISLGYLQMIPNDDFLEIRFFQSSTSNSLSEKFILFLYSEFLALLYHNFKRKINYSTILYREPTFTIPPLYPDPNIIVDIEPHLYMNRVQYLIIEKLLNSRSSYDYDDILFKVTDNNLSCNKEEFDDLVRIKYEITYDRIFFIFSSYSNSSFKSKKRIFLLVSLFSYFLKNNFSDYIFSLQNLHP